MLRTLPLFLVLAVLPRQADAQAYPEPPNAPALVRLTDTTVAFEYHGRPIIQARLSRPGGRVTVDQLTDSSGGRITQVIKWTVRSGQLSLDGVVRTSAEGFAAAAEPREDGLPVVRHAVGGVANGLNRGVYDRRDDWVLSVDEPARVSVVPLEGVDSAAAFRLMATGGEITLRFRPRFYQRHRGLAEFRPWTYQPWKESVAGWSSWYAFFDNVTEQDVRRTADVMGEVLRPFGYRYLQIDDGYQQLPIGLPEHWLTANQKFPSGLDSLRRYVSTRGLEPGIWTNVSFQDSAAAMAHPGWFVKGTDGRPAWGRWVGYVMDGSAAGTMDTLVTPVYRGLRGMGWTYFKLDALRHLRYEGYNSYAGHFVPRRLDREAVFRGFVRQVRLAIGTDVYLLACWGIRPELIGLVDGVRVGDDGFGYGAFAEYNSFNNVVWRNDPDHIEIHQPDGYRAATLASLTGSVLMLTDRPEVYRTARVEAAKRTAPVLFTVPGQLYDVDPSRSSRLAETATEVSGSGPRPFDADQREVVNLYQLDIARPFGQWSVLARTGGSSVIPLAELGLVAGTNYVGFEFWTRRNLGVVRDTLRAGPIDTHFKVQVFCLRRREDHPQLLGTGRHVTCGGPDLDEVRWEGNAPSGTVGATREGAMLSGTGGGAREGATLSGTSALVAGDPYEIFLTEPAGWRLQSVEAEGARVTGRHLSGGMRVIRLESAKGGAARWRVRYDRRPGAGS